MVDSLSHLDPGDDIKSILNLAVALTVITSNATEIEPDSKVKQYKLQINIIFNMDY